MELGLSLGDARESVDGILKENNTQDKRTEKKSELRFCMALGLNSSYVENDEEIHEDINGGGNYLQLNLIPLAHVSTISSHLQSSNNGSLENGSSGNMGLAAAIGLDVNKLPVAVAEVSSENSDGSRLHMDFATCRNSGNGNLIRGNKRENDVVASSRACSDHDDENGLNTRKKLRLSKDQSAFLEESFQQHHTLNPKQKFALAKQLNLRPRQVEVWFQNRRARTKLKQTEVDCEYLKRFCETLTEENQRLHKELQELRALKTPNPFYMQLPPTTLTMCPSCERVATAPPPTTATAAPKTSVVGDTATPIAIAFPLTRPRFNYPFPTSLSPKAS